MGRQRRSLVGEEVEEVEDDSELINLDSQIVDEIAERRRRSLEEDEEVEVLEEEELEEEHETDYFDEPDDKSEENHGERQKRGLGWLNKQTPQKNCVTQKKCVNHKKQTCIPFPKKKCETKMIEKCQTVQRQ